MKRLLAIFGLVLGMTGQLRAVQPSGGPANIAGTLYASNFATWSVPQGNNGPFSWSSPQVCTNASSGGVDFQPFVAGSPIRIVDNGAPVNSETVSPTAVNITGSGCTLSVNPAHQHYSFYLTTATAGLQDAINYANQSLGAMTPSAVVILTPAWAQLGGTTSMITSAIGNSRVTLLDQRTSVSFPYIWDGTKYVVTPYGGGGNVDPASIPHPCTYYANAGTTVSPNPICTVTPAGDMGTRSVTLGLDPVQPLQAATKQYVDCDPNTKTQNDIRCFAGSVSAKGDSWLITSGLAITTGSNTVTLSGTGCLGASGTVTCAFTPADTGKILSIKGAGSQYGTGMDWAPLDGIMTYVDSTHVTLTDSGGSPLNASHTVTSAAGYKETTDYTAAITEAYNDSVETNLPLYIAPGFWWFGELGSASAVNGWISPNITGAGAANSRILMPHNTYLIDDTGPWHGLYILNVAFYGGKGALRTRAISPYDFGNYDILMSNFQNYTETAVASNMVDNPYWYVCRSLFNADNSSNTIGIALGGGNDNSIFSCGNTWNYNRVHLKLNHASSTAITGENEFIQFAQEPTPDSYSRASLWIAGQTSKKLEVTGANFGNENLDPKDYRILLADNDATKCNDPDLVGSCPVSNQFWSTAESTGSYIQMNIHDNLFTGSGSTQIPIIDSFSQDLRSNIVRDNQLNGTPAGYHFFIEPVASQTTFVRNNICGTMGINTVASGVFGQIGGSNRAGYCVDADLLRVATQTNPEANGPPANTATPNTLIQVVKTALSGWGNGTGVTHTPIVDSWGGTNATQIDFGASNQSLNNNPGMTTVAGLPYSISFDVKADAGTGIAATAIKITWGTNGSVQFIPIVADGQWHHKNLTYTPKSAEPTTIAINCAATATLTCSSGAFVDVANFDGYQSSTFKPGGGFFGGLNSSGPTAGYYFNGVFGLGLNVASGAPTGSCATGATYDRSDTGARYSCKAGAWVLDFSSLNSLTGDVALAAGSNITITPSGNTLTIASTGGMVYPGAGVAVSTGTAWGTSIAAANIPLLNASNTFTGFYNTFDNLEVGLPITSGNASSPDFLIWGQFYNGSITSQDLWGEQVVVGSGTNPSTTLMFSHTGSSGFASVSLPALQIAGITGSTQCLQVDTTGLVSGTACTGGGFITSLTTTGSSGAATVTSGVLNIPNYTYTLPQATTSVLGGVKPDGTTCTTTSGVLTCPGSGGISGLTTGIYPIATSPTAIGNGHLDEVTNAGSITSSLPIIAPSYSTNGTWPGKFSLTAGTGSIPALPTNSAGFAGPVTGGTSWLGKLPATINAGILHFAAPGTVDGVNESAITSSLVSLTADVTGSLPNANIANPSTTVNGVTCTLGSTCTVTSAGIANITVTISSATYTANSKSTVATATMTGLTTSSGVHWTPSADYSAVTGWGTTGGLEIFSWPSAANTVSYYVINPTGSSITTGSSTTWILDAK